MKIKYIVVHCSATPNDREVTAEEIHSWHKARKWDGIGYHAVIRRSGLVERGRPEYWQGAHVEGYNEDSLGVCLVGMDKFTEAQWTALLSWIKDEKLKYPEAEVVGHCDLDSRKTCPNFNVKEWYNEHFENTKESSNGHERGFLK